MKNLLCLLALLLCTTVFAQPQQVVVGVSGNGYVTRQLFINIGIIHKIN